MPLATSGLLLLTFHPFNVSWMVWMALVPWWVWLADPSRSAREAFLGSFCAGLLYYVGISVPFLSLEWWGWGVINAEELPWYVLRQRLFILGVSVALSAWGALFWGLFGWLIHRHARHPWARLLLLSACWTLLIEYLPHQTVGGLSWGLLGYRLHDALLIRQVAALAGVYGLGFLIAFVNAALAIWVHATRTLQPAVAIIDRPLRRVARQGRIAVNQRPVGGVVGLGVLTVLAGAGYGLVTIQNADTVTGAAMKAAVLQGNVLEYTEADLTPEGMDKAYLPLIDQALAEMADLIILPETVGSRVLQVDGTRSPWVSERQGMSRDDLRQAYAAKLEGSSSLMVHGIDAMKDGQGYNALAFWDAAGLRGMYFKRRLVPFTEFRPRGLGRLSPQNQLHGTGFEYTAGTGPRLVPFRTLPIGGFICHEIMFPHLARESVLAGAQLLVSAGNDGMFKNAIVAEEQAVMARFRAVEEGRYLIRSMKSGVSAIIDPWGRELARIPVGEQGVVSEYVRAIPRLTTYAHWGDWIVWMAGLLALGGLFLRRRGGAST